MHRMNETMSVVLGKDVMPGMVIGMPSPIDRMSNESRLVLATKRVLQKRLFGKWVEEDDTIELLVVANAAPELFVVYAVPNMNYPLENSVQFMLNYTGPSIPDKVWVAARKA